MGFLDIFSSKKTQESDSLRQDILELKQNFEKLSKNVRVAEKNIGTIYEAMDVILKDIGKNAEDIAKAVKSGNFRQAGAPDAGPETGLGKLKLQLEETESGMREIGRKMQEMMRISRLSIQNYDEIKAIKRQLNHKETASQRGLAVGGAFEFHKSKSQGLSPKESKIVNALMNGEVPLTYEEIASLVNISPITVKGYINSIKKINPEIIVESAKGRGRKAYSIKPEYKIKVLSGRG